jgi:hypothetical protein
MPTPSLLIVPARLKSGKLYSQIPTSGAGDFTVTRATNATLVNASGLIESVASGIPRLDYFTSGGTVGCPALLVEPSAQNLAFHSTDWTSNWNGGSASGTTVITNSAISLAPDGTATANEIYLTSGNTNHNRNSNATTATTYTSGTIYTMSAFFKAGVGVGTRIQLTYTVTRFSQNGYANFDLIAGTVLVVSGTTADTNRAARIENYGNGWYRCSFAATCTSNGTGLGFSVNLINASGDTRSPSFSGTVTDYLLGWGAQLETGSVATSYIPTTTAAVTRNADAVLVSGAVSGSIGQTEGTIYAEVDVRTLGAAKNILQIDNGTATNRIGLFVDISPTRLTFLMSSGGVTNSLSGTVATGVIKIAASYSSGNVQVFTNGSFLVSGTITTYPIVALNAISVGSRISSGVYGVFLNDRILDAALYTTRLSNAELAALTA